MSAGHIYACRYCMLLYAYRYPDFGRSYRSVYIVHSFHLYQQAYKHDVYVLDNFYIDTRWDGVGEVPLTGRYNRSSVYRKMQLVLSREPQQRNSNRSSAGQLSDISMSDNSISWLFLTALQFISTDEKIQGVLI